MNIDYKNLPIYINDNFIFANSLNLSFNNSYQRIDSLGAETVLTVRDSRPRANFDATFYSTTGLSNILNLTGCQAVKVNFGEFYFNSGFINNISINITPNGLIESSIGIDLYEELKSSSFSVNKEEHAIEKIAHGNNTNFYLDEEILINKKLISASIAINQSIQVEFEISKTNIIGAYLQDGSIECEIQGTGLQDIINISKIQNSNAFLNLKNMCNIESEQINFYNLKMRDYNISVNGESVDGSVSLVRYF